MDINTLEFLIKQEIFSKTNYSKTFNDAIINKEILMSRKIIENGWNIGSLLKIYNGVNFINVNAYINRIKFYDDIMYGIFNGNLWIPSELIFIKGNRPGLDKITPDNM